MRTTVLGLLLLAEGAFAAKSQYTGIRYRLLTRVIGDDSLARIIPQRLINKE